MNSASQLDRKSGVFLITPVSPIHIGTGEKYIPEEYCYQKNTIIIKDILKFIDANRDNPQFAYDTIISASDTITQVRYQIPYHGKPFWGQSEQKRQAKPVQIAGGPRGKIDPQVAKLMRDSEKAVPQKVATPSPREQEFKNPEIFIFMKDPFDKPFLPGSSIKGCLRTALAWQLVKDNPQLIQSLQKACQHKSPKRERAFECISDVIFGKNATDDPLKTLVIRDSSPLDLTKSLAVSHVQVVSLNAQNKLQEKTNMRILAEVLTPKTGTIQMPFYIDYFRLTRDDKNLPQEAKSILNDPAKFIETLRAFSRELLNQQIKFYTEHNSSDALRFLKDLEKQDYIYLDLGFGTGWEAKTIGLAFDKETLKDFRRIFRLGKAGHPIFPKSRKLACYDDRYIPMGWFKLEIKWE